MRLVFGVSYAQTMTALVCNYSLIPSPHLFETIRSITAASVSALSAGTSSAGPCSCSADWYRRPIPDTSLRTFAATYRRTSRLSAELPSSQLGS